MNMFTEAGVSRAAANAVYDLISEYLTQGGAGHDEAGLLEFLGALGEADRIVIGENDNG